MEKQRLDNMLGALSLALMDRLREAIASASALNETAVFALVLLSQRPAVTIDVLAKQLALAHSTVVRLVERLVDDGYIERNSGADRRAVFLSLTAAGRDHAEVVLEARRNAIGSLTDQLPETMQTALIAICEQLLERMSVDALTSVRNCRLCDEKACDLECCPVEKQYRLQVS
ncbi:MarR family winged helix-turn-helix transcriptional regulator [Paraburkholderia caballeronis]|uniref:MarR family winged helix-turn-helix transcriptional regulator n=1 Tax=Paraburkholderia caballeronis TaxID=416943 RepID=UPI0010E4E7B5|nr:MarR family transcriptional regulator [Paraburkholderia caballeronis]TDV19448.1 MarR family transcriptional regulator [Paraburkholderia caballeronis]TDV22048.1 MarR family transcriptional regulator [Paraburkholderia caballeronis]TDV28952.1 MarR family transcriptional regulator [Paraburkholderia caballeronis]